MVRSIGAHHVVDYTGEDFTRSGQRHDLMLDSVGNQSLSACKRALTAEGTLVPVGSADNGRWLGPLRGLLEAVVPAIDRSYPLSDVPGCPVSGRWPRQRESRRNDGASLAGIAVSWPGTAAGSHWA